MTSRVSGIFHLASRGSSIPCALRHCGNSREQFASRSRPLEGFCVQGLHIYIECKFYARNTARCLSSRNLESSWGYSTYMHERYISEANSRVAGNITYRTSLKMRWKQCMVKKSEIRSYWVTLFFFSSYPFLATLDLNI